MTVVGKLVEGGDLISYILGGLNPSYTAFITSYNFATHDIPMTFQDFQAEILNFETLLGNQHQTVGDSGSFALYSQKPKPAWSNHNNKGKSFG